VVSVDLFDTSDCPTGRECAGCGRARGALRLSTLDTPVGVLCLTFCRDCRKDERLPSMSWPQAVYAVWEHCDHLGITADEMAELVEAEREDDRPFLERVMR
jgi:hypothetical protein